MRTMQHKPSVVLATCILCIAACGNEEGQSQGQDPSIPVILNPQVDSPTAPAQESPSNEKDLVGQPESPNGEGPSAPTPQRPQVPEPPVQPTGSVVTVEVNGIRKIKGNVCLSMFNSPD